MCQFRRIDTDKPHLAAILQSHRIAIIHIGHPHIFIHMSRRAADSACRRQPGDGYQQGDHRGPKPHCCTLTGHKKGAPDHCAPPVPTDQRPPLLFHAVFLLEFIHTPGSVHQLLFSGVKRMACRTDIQVQIMPRGRTYCKAVAATTCCRKRFVSWMDPRFHILYLYSP